MSFNAPALAVLTADDSGAEFSAHTSSPTFLALVLEKK